MPDRRAAIDGGNRGGARFPNHGIRGLGRDWCGDVVRCTSVRSLCDITPVCHLTVPRPLRIATASRWLATLSLVGAAIGFGYDSLVVAALGPGTSTDAYFLSLGVVAFLPTLFYLTATNVIVPLLGSTADYRAAKDRALWGWLTVGALGGVALIVGRQLLAAALSSDPVVRVQAARGLTVLAFVPPLSAWSEYRRGRLLASGQYHATGFYV